MPKASPSSNKRGGMFARPMRRHASFAVVSPQKAIAARSAAKKGPEGRASLRSKRSTDRGWQRDAYDYAETIGEVGYIHHLKSMLVSRCNLVVWERTGVTGKATADEANPIPIPARRANGETATGTSEGVEWVESENPATLAVMEAFVGPQGGQRELKRRAALHLSIGGESILVGTETEDINRVPTGALWEFLSTEEIEIDNSGKVTRNVDVGTPYTLDEDRHYFARLWRADARFSDRADSEMKRVLSLCREVILLSQMVDAVTRSRLSAGLLYIPEEVDFPVEDHEDTDTDVEHDDTEGLTQFVEELISHMSAAVEDRDDTAALVPLVMRGPAEYVDSVRLIDLARDLDTWAKDLREEVLVRIARGLDIPPEIFEGKTSLSHWTAWSVDADLLAKHVIPLGELIAEFVTVAYMRPMLEECYGFTPEQSGRFEVRLDASPITARSDESNAARLLHDKVKLSDKALLEANGFDEGDLPSADEFRVRMAIQFATSAPVSLGPIMIPLIPGFEDVDFSAMNQGNEPGGVQDPLGVDGGADGAGVGDSDQSGQGLPPDAGPLTTAALLPARLGQAADAAYERAMERAGAKITGKAKGSQQAALRALDKLDVLPAVTAADLAELGLSLDDLFDGAWDRLAETATVICAQTFTEVGVEPMVAADRAALVATALCENLREWIEADPHRRVHRREGGLRVPAALVDRALMAASVTL